ncbi:MAG: helix-turn-helix transcriptional regulator [Lactobacillales bacterium]|nr:helix-turn-helix transcriptional regulator [Lactobacillales bacterium]
MGDIKISDIAALGLKIRQSRKHQKLTQSELSGIAGTGVRFISDLENGKENVHLGKMFSVLNALGLKLFLSDDWKNI